MTLTVAAKGQFGSSHVNTSNFQMKGVALGLALKQGQKTAWKSPINMVKYLEVCLWP